MQVVVSTSLATASSRFRPAPGTGPGWAEILMISRLAWLMMVTSCLLDLHQETLEFGRVGIGIVNGRRQPVDQRPLVPAFVLGDAAVALVDRNADLVDLLAVDHHGLDAARHEGLGDVVTPRARHLHLLTALDAELRRELDRNLDERLGDELHVDR